MGKKDDAGRTALHLACRAGRVEIFEQLVENDEIDVDSITNAGVTPLMMAVESGSIQLVAAALNSNLNPFMRDALGR